MTRRDVEMSKAVGKASAALEGVARGIRAVEAGRPIHTLRELADYAERVQRELDSILEVRHAG